MTKTATKTDEFLSTRRKLNENTSDRLCWSPEKKNRICVSSSRSRITLGGSKNGTI